MTTLCTKFCPAELKREFYNYAFEKALGRSRGEKETCVENQETETEYREGEKEEADQKEAAGNLGKAMKSSIDLVSTTYE